MVKPERQVWPSRWPQATIIALLIPLALLWGFWDNVRPSFTPLQSYYLGRYLRSVATGWLGLNNGNSLIYVLTDRNTARPALDAEVIPMPRSIRAMNPKAVPFTHQENDERRGSEAPPASCQVRDTQQAHERRGVS